MGQKHDGILQEMSHCILGISYVPIVAYMSTGFSGQRVGRSIGDKGWAGGGQGWARGGQGVGRGGQWVGRSIGVGRSI